MARKFAVHFLDQKSLRAVVDLGYQINLPLEGYLVLFFISGGEDPAGLSRQLRDIAE
jgi:hypothetical protein